MNADQVAQKVQKWGISETLFTLWVGLAIAVLVPVMVFLQGSFPLFTVIWLGAPLLIFLRTRDARRVGFLPIPWKLFLSTAAINLGALLVISLMVEPWSHAYQALVKAALASQPLDTTFGWLVRLEGARGWFGLIVYSGFVTIFGEELFFRGWLLQSLLRKMDRFWAILIQAAIFTLPQLLAALLLAPLQGAVYAIAYSWIAVGVVGGWAAARTRSIWPSLVSATLWNAIMAAIAVSQVAG
jgi:membrane protease YdiL (CAAX protease family)